jgi:hypothetical protein
LQIAREFIAAVGQEIAGGKEQTRRHGTAKDSNKTSPEPI